MLESLDSHADIARLTDRLLRAADAYGRFPTPVGDIVAAAGLSEPPETFLTESSIAAMPSHLHSVLRRVAGKVHAALDRTTREVHINPETDLVEQRAFKRLHETAHDLFPWQHIDSGALGYADNDLTLSPSTTVLFEREANQGAAELLFQRDRFSEIAADYRTSCASVLELAARFGASRHATFRRYVESHRGAVAGVVLGPAPCGGEALTYRRREAMCSPAWLSRFEDPVTWPTVLRANPFAFVEQARACAGLGSPSGTWRYPDRDSLITTLHVEAMSNTYRTFVLIWLPRKERLKHRRALAPAA